MTTMTLAELQQKYGKLMETTRRLGFSGLELREVDGCLMIKGEAPYQLDKNLFWDELKSFSDWKKELKADISVKHKDVYGFHTVVSGDTLSKLAERYLGDAKRFNDILALNKDIVSDPNLIKVGQKLKLPAKA